MKKVFSRLMILGVFLSTIVGGQGFAFAQSQTETRFFPQTQQSVSGRFLEYWNQNGGLLQQGYPISPVLDEQSVIDGKTYTVQYFERAVFEMHPENPRPYDVELALLGVLAYRQKYPNGAPNQVPNTDPGSISFPATGKRLGGSFLVYFNQHGGVTQQGLPISDEFQEISSLDGKERTVQYFERAVFEWNPSNFPPYNVLLSQLGTFAYKARPTPSPEPVPPLPTPIFPPPAAGKDQYSPIGNDRYLVWSEGQLTTDQGGIVNTFDLRALDLRSNSVITVTDAQGDQGDQVLDGNLVAWGSDSTSCAGCPSSASGVYATDLATGQQYTVATGFVPQGTIGISGRKIAWLEADVAGQRLKVKDLDTNEITLVREVATDAPYLTGLQMSGNNLIWNEIAYNDAKGDSKVSYIKAYDLKTGQTHDAYSYVLDPTNSVLPHFALSGDRLVLQDGESNVFVKDLPSNDSFELAYKGLMNNLVVQGDLVLFSSSPNDADINGINLKRANTVVPIINSVPGSFAQYEFTVAGGRLVYVDADGNPARTDRPRLEVRELPDALK